jgi:tetratricopeptide (TPR) repeat protein
MAWRQGTVPHYITSNPFMANAYARVVLGFLCDCQAGPAPLVPDQPLYIVELGAGSGRFAFHFLKKLQGWQARSAFQELPVKYVMTDFARPTIDAWQAHPWLRPLVAQGLLDYAQFDVVADQELKLIHSGEILAPGTVGNPLVVIANYFFDSIPQDAFYINEGKLYESLVTMTAPNDLADSELLKQIEISYEQRPVDGDYYDDPACNHILRGYQERLTDTFLLFPCAAIDGLRRLGRLSQGRLLLLSADKGYHRAADLQGRGPAGITVHGSFSMMVNYHALGQYVRHQGGQALGTDRRHNSLNVSAFILGEPSSGAVETRQAYTAAIEQFGPDDFYTLKKGIEKIYDTLTLPQLLAYLRLSGWDANILLGCFPTLLGRVDSLSEAEREALSEAIQQVWDIYYPIGEERDLAFELGMLVYGMANYAEALEFFRRSLSLYGRDASTAYNIGMCHYGLGQVAAALAWVGQALKIDPSFDAAREMWSSIQAEIRLYDAGEGNAESTE